MARFAAKTYYLFEGHPTQANLVGAYRGLKAAKEAGDGPYGHAARWVKSVFSHGGDEWLTQYTGGSGNRATICDYLPPGVVVPADMGTGTRRR